MLPTEEELAREIEVVFDSESTPDFNDPEILQKLNEGLTLFQSKWLEPAERGNIRIWPHIIGGHEIISDKIFFSENPYNGDQLAAFCQTPPPSPRFEKAMQRVLKAQKRWEMLGYKVRAEFLYRLAHIFMREDITYMCVAALVTEIGMSPAEAWGEYNEVYRFLLQTALFTIREYKHGNSFESASFAGDTQLTYLKPYGIGIAICPFNFPLAIPSNMLAYMLGFGNAVFLKGSDKAALTTRILFAACEDALSEIGIKNNGIVNYTPGPGGDMARLLLARPEVKLFSFTGSSEVFRGILNEFQFMDRVGGNQLQVGCAETSGVNIMLVCNDANPKDVAEAAVKGIAGRSSQKCSSTKIILVQDLLFDVLLEELQGGLDAVLYGNVRDGACLGPLISSEAKKRALEFLEILLEKKIVWRVYKKQISASPSGYDVPPTILVTRKDAREDSERMKILFNTEVFAPIVTMVPFSNHKNAEWLISHTQFGLTGAVFAESPSELAWGLKLLPSGMRYIRRKQTGATVAERFHGAGGTASSYNGGIVGQSLCARHYTPIELSGTLPRQWTGENMRNFLAEFGENIIIAKKPKL